MFDKLQNPLALAGRVLLASLFLPAGIAKIAGFEGTVGYIASVGLPLPELGALLAIAVEVIGGIALLTGFCARPAALVLAVFTVVASYFFHGYWRLPADQQFMQQLMFFKNIAVAGGLLMLAAWGAGAWSIDARRNAAPAARGRFSLAA